MKSVILLAIFLGSAWSIFAQNKMENGLQPLKVGDTVPDIEFTNLINYHSKTARLSDFKDKLVILDFWATWCGSCLNNLAKLDSLQLKHSDKMQVILVNSKGTGDDSAKVKALFNRLEKSNGRAYPFPSLYNDTILSTYFEHQLIPHYVWIYEGIVRGITASHEVSEENIYRIIRESSSQLMLKKDIDTQKPLFISEDAPLNNLEQYSIFLKGRIDGLPSANRYRKSGSIVRGRAMTNSSLYTMFYITGMNLIENFTKNRIVLKVKDSTSLIFDGNKSDKEEWYRNNSFTYELIVPAKESENLYRYMLDDLNKYSGYSGKIKKMVVPCLILIQASDFIEKTSKKENLMYPAIQVSDLINRLNRLETHHPILNETNYSNEINIPLPTILNDWRLVKKYLNAYGLDLIEGKREIEMLMLADKI